MQVNQNESQLHFEMLGDITCNIGLAQTNGVAGPKLSHSLHRPVLHVNGEQPCHVLVVPVVTLSVENYLDLL